jgi:hypothetical protein
MATFISIKSKRNISNDTIVNTKMNKLSHTLLFMSLF